jgi:hypothetical protein
MLLSVAHTTGPGVQQWHEERIINCNGCRRKWPWPMWTTIPIYPWMDWENPQKTPVIVAALQDQESIPRQYDEQEDFWRGGRWLGEGRNINKNGTPAALKFCFMDSLWSQWSVWKWIWRGSEQKTKLHYRLRRVSYRTSTVCCNV